MSISRSREICSHLASDPATWTTAEVKDGPVLIAQASAQSDSCHRAIKSAVLQNSDNQYVPVLIPYH